MKTLAQDTIAAIATPPGRGGIGIIRISGTHATVVAKQLTGRTTVPLRHACFVSFLDRDQTIIDQGILLRFVAPASFTGEDMIELQAHGSPVVLKLLMQRLADFGVRPAEPGEFSRRAFENGKYDLSQLEAIAGLIDSTTARAARSAQRTLQGEFSRQLQALHEALKALRIQIESAIDFSDEDIELISVTECTQQLNAMMQQFSTLKTRAREGLRLHSGVEAVLVGHPNVGKSSLLNALAGRDEAIVSAMAGTTRDVLKCELLLDGIPLRLLDTAGLREPRDGVEQQGVERAYTALRQTDLILLVVDATRRSETESNFPKPLPSNSIPCLKIYNKIDLLKPEEQDDVLRQYGVSAKTGAGLAALIQRLTATFGIVDEDVVMVQQRHLVAIEDAAAAVQTASECPTELELVAEELRYAQQALAAITGAVTTEALLGEIFSRFCIGK